MQPRVTLAELGVASLAELNGGYKIEDDWRGDASLSLDDAAEFVRKRREATEAHEARWAEHQRASERWLEERSRAGREAAARVRRNRTTPQAAAEAREAWISAAAEWERKHKRPEFDGVVSIPDAAMVTYSAGDPVGEEVPA